MTISVPPVCPRCKGSRKLVIILPDNGDPKFKMPPGWDFISPRPKCPVCHGRGTLVEVPYGEYPPPPRDYDPVQPRPKASDGPNPRLDED